jgi:hypothetical protein
MQFVAYLAGLIHQIAHLYHLLAGALAAAWTWTGGHWYLGLAAVAGALIVAALLARRTESR